MQKSRILNFENLYSEIESFRLDKENFSYHYHIKKFPNGNETQKCSICDLQMNPYGVYTKNDVAICIQCFNKFVIDEAYLANIATFKSKIEKANQYSQTLFNRIIHNEVIDEDFLNSFFKEMTLKEIEYYIGLPYRYGSFDHGLESGFWEINKIKVEIWLQNEVYSSVDLIK